MANAKAIKAKIKSIWNIQKITSALEIVSTVKLQKVKDIADHFKQYMTEFLYILDMINLGKILSQKEDIKTDKELIVVISTEKGLCGALNSKLFKNIYEETEKNKDNIDVFCIGKKALEFFTRSWYNITWVSNLKDNFTEADLNTLRWIISSSIDEKNYKTIKVYYNYFKNTMTQIPVSMQVFPLEKENFEQFANTIELDISDITINEYNEDIIIEPSEEEYYEFVYKKFISDMVYGAVLQNKAGEHASRMIAMKNAKDNSIDLQKWLKITYNKQRQSAVTQEISEIVWAKAAMEE
jgi:F-type H+-transporting ATPase subunit gamma